MYKRQDLIRLLPILVIVTYHYGVEDVYKRQLYPHAETWRAAGTVREAFFLNQPALAVAGGTPGEAFCLAAVEAPNIVVETIKQAEDGDGIIVRMYECDNLSLIHI